jgi:hypothetical protein
VGGGFAYPHGLDRGGYGRAELGIRGGDDHGLQVRLMLFGLEGWGSRHGGGGAVPVTAQIGYKKSVLYAEVGGGLQLITFEQVRGDNSVGALSPVAVGNVGLVLGPVRVSADVRAQYRWQLGADNRALYTAGLALGFDLD